MYSLKGKFSGRYILQFVLIRGVGTGTTRHSEGSMGKEERWILKVEREVRAQKGTEAPDLRFPSMHSEIMICFLTATPPNTYQPLVPSSICLSLLPISRHPGREYSNSSKGFLVSKPGDRRSSTQSNPEHEPC